LTAPPPVTMFNTCVVLRAKATTLVASASVRRVADAAPPPRFTVNVANPKSSGLLSYGPGVAASSPAFDNVACNVEIRFV
jgi:hypothetical protein